MFATDGSSNKQCDKAYLNQTRIFCVEAQPLMKYASAASWPQGDKRHLHSKGALGTTYSRTSSLESIRQCQRLQGHPGTSILLYR